MQKNHHPQRVTSTRTFIIRRYLSVPTPPPTLFGECFCDRQPLCTRQTSTEVMQPLQSSTLNGLSWGAEHFFQNNMTHSQLHFGPLTDSMMLVPGFSRLMATTQICHTVSARAMDEAKSESTTSDQMDQNEQQQQQQI